MRPHQVVDLLPMQLPQLVFAQFLVQLLTYSRLVTALLLQLRRVQPHWRLSQQQQASHLLERRLQLRKQLLVPRVRQ